MDENKAKLNFVQRIIGIIISPKRTFAYLADNPDLQTPIFAIATLVLLSFLKDLNDPTTLLFGQTWVGYTLGILVMSLVIWSIIWSILSVELCLLGKIVKIKFGWSQSYTITGYAFVIPFIAASIIKGTFVISVIRYLVICFKVNLPISLLDSDNIFLIIFSLYNILLLALAVHSITKKTIKTAVIAVIYGFLIAGINYFLLSHGKIIERHFKNDGNVDGIYRQYYEGIKLKGEISYRNGKEYGVARWYSKDGSLISEINYKNGKLDGMCTYYQSDSNVEVVSFKKGKKDGFEKLYKSGILIIETPYQNNKENGVRKMYYGAGKLSSERPFIKGKANGIFKEYYENGNLKWEMPWKNNKRVESYKEYYENGQLKEEQPYKKGRREGISKEYYKNGTLKQETTWKKGRKEGSSKKYYESGKLKGEATYKNNLLNGNYKMYKEDGTLDVAGSYVYGVKVRKGIPQWKYWALKVLNSVLRLYRGSLVSELYYS